MLNVLILAVMLALAAFWSPAKPELDTLIAKTGKRDTAGDMSVYRSAVVRYFTQNPDETGQVPPAALAAAGVLPSWSRLAADGGAQWAHYRSDDGTIFIYPREAQSRSIAAELEAVSAHSRMVGVHRSGEVYVRSPLGALVAVPVPAAAAIPQGSPVWIAQAN
jgi:hypothetical protein